MAGRAADSDHVVDRCRGQGAQRRSALLAVLSHVDEFGRTLLTAWKPRAPKLRGTDGPVERETADVPESVESAIESAGEEADGR
jgi:hypothetical protein